MLRQATLADRFQVYQEVLRRLEEEIAVVAQQSDIRREINEKFDLHRANIRRADERLTALEKTALDTDERLDGHGKTLALIGLGNVGTQVAHMASALGMTVVAYDPYISEVPRGVSAKLIPDLEAVLRQADFVSVHVPLTPQTRIPLLTAGTVDIICESSTHTLGRSRQISFLNTTFLTGSKLLVRKSSGIKKIEHMTDKALVEVPAPVAGVVVQRGGREGAVLKVGELLVALDERPPLATFAQHQGMAREGAAQRAMEQE